MKYYLAVICLFGGIAFILNACYWFRIPTTDDFSTTHKQPVYDQIILVFLDATGYRYIANEDKEPIYNVITTLKELQSAHPESTFLTKTVAVPPSTDFTILSLINGVKQMSNYLDIIFKNGPTAKESSLLKKPISSALFSSKKADWFKMTSGEFTYVENSHNFNASNIPLADNSAFTYFQQLFNSVNGQNYSLLIQHFMGFDALGHALQYQNYTLGYQLLDMYNNALVWIVERLKPNQLLIVLGDHDQSYRGKHYQCSEESKECEGFIFAYRKDGLFNGTLYNHYEASDVSATMHALLGFETTNQNMGKIISHMYPPDHEERIRSDEYMTMDRMIAHITNQMPQFSKSYVQSLLNKEPQHVFEAMQLNFFFGRPYKISFIIGLVLIGISLIPIIKQQNVWKITALFSLSSLFIPILDIIVLFRIMRESVITRIIKLSILSTILLFGSKYINGIPIEIQFIVALMSKLYFASQFKFDINSKSMFLICLTVLSQLFVYMFFFIDRTDYDTRKLIALILIVNLVVFGFVDPRYFGKGRVKSLYIVLLFLFGDIAVIFQLSPQFTFTQFVLFYVFADIDNGLHNIIISKLICSYISPIMIPHSVYKGYNQLNMNALIILVHEFEVGPSLLSIFFGYFGLQLIAATTLLIKSRDCTPFLLGRITIGIMISMIGLLIFEHSVSNPNVDHQMFTLYSLPIQLMELIIYYLVWILQ